MLAHPVVAAVSDRRRRSEIDATIYVPPYSTRSAVAPWLLWLVKWALRRSDHARRTGSRSSNARSQYCLMHECPPRTLFC